MKVLIFLSFSIYFFLLLNLKNIFLINHEESMKLEEKRYDCVYSKLLCSFRSTDKFYAGCYPVFKQIVYNQTECPPMKDSFLTGFTSRIKLIGS